MEKIGIDIVGVIMDRLTLSDLIRKYGRNIPYRYFEKIPEINGIIGAVYGIVNYFRSENVFIVSSADEALEKAILHWFEKKSILKRTGVSSDNLIFCRERKEKAIVCAQKQITHFIDDRREVLHHIYESDPSIKLILFNPDEKEDSNFRKYQSHFTILLPDPKRIYSAIRNDFKIKRA